MSSATPPNTQPTQATFKDRLDEAAKEAGQPASVHDKSSSSSLMEKVAEYIPAASRTKNGQEQHEAPPSRELAGPPDRPEHDGHIAEFVRQQHRSKKLDGDSED
ncbi:hypothetical protein F5Y12DRAFT_716756 [Xylaria sp. FL1777]|nr:hypothetical protein F5Y12DRAFT_716756 [Xylaria sp. FL1777]